MRRFAIRVAALPAALLATMACLDAQAYDYTAPVPFHALANFDPANSVIPFPNNLLRLGSKDLTINAPLPSDPAKAGPVVALNALDGFSTVAPWSTSFSTALTASSVVGGSSVRFFEVSTDAATGAVTGVKAELKSPQQFVATLASNAATGATLAIVPTAPLKPLTSYMAVVTNGVSDAAGVSVHPSLVYLLAKRTSPLCVNGASTIPALPAAESCALEPLRQLTNTQEAAASAAGVDASKIVISWTATTGSTYLPMKALTGLIDAVPATGIAVVPTGKDLSFANAALPPVADIYIGALTIPYYLSPPSQTNPTAPLTASWTAKAGGYLPPFDKAGLDPTSTNVTFANPLPVATSNQKIPVLVTLPNAKSGKTKPASGWPVVIFQHGFTRNRTDAFGIAGGLAAAGFAVIAIDLPLHGLTDKTNPLYRNQALTGSPAAGLITGERTFDVDYQNNDTGASGPDGKIDQSGIYFFNPASLLTTRDNFRQGVADLLELRSAIPAVLDPADGSAMFDKARVSYGGQSLGGIEGTMFMALSTTPNTATQTGVLNVPGGGLVGLALGSVNIGPPILAGLAAAGLKPGTADFSAFTVVAQTAVDAGDPINYAALTAGKNLLVQEVVGGSAPIAGDPSASACPTCYDANGKWKNDQTVPNTSAGFPLSGTEALIGALGLTSLTSTAQSATGLRGAVRFVTGVHGSLLDPTSPQTTVEMQKQAITFIASGGTTVPITNTSVIKTSESPDGSDVAPSGDNDNGN